jgi:ceramide glucosyltransferase
MSVILNGGLAALSLLLGLAPLVLTARFKRALPIMMRRKVDPDYRPPVSVILPCKGLDQGFEQNILALLSQDYPDMELLFVVATDDDPAFGALQRLVTSHKAAGSRARLLTAGIATNRAQKLNNQLAAIAQCSPRCEVLVFIDSDCRPDAGFITRLIGPLSNAAVGASTGYRWYHPPVPSLGSMLRSTWNAGALPFLADPRTSHAWGGAMAIRRQTFESVGLATVWAGAVSDDMTLTVTMHKQGLRLEFVPQCMAVSYESSTLTETLEFTNRQSLISRVYFPPVWWGAAVGHAAVNLLIAYGALNLIIWTTVGGTAWPVGALCMIALPLQWINAYWLFDSIPNLLPERIQSEVRRLRWRYVLTAPLASLMTLVNTTNAAMSRRITWRGITYELRSATETIVVTEQS